MSLLGIVCTKACATYRNIVRIRTKASASYRIIVRTRTKVSATYHTIVRIHIKASATYCTIVWFHAKVSASYRIIVRIHTKVISAPIIGKKSFLKSLIFCSIFYKNQIFLKIITLLPKNISIKMTKYITKQPFG